MPPEPVQLHYKSSELLQAIEIVNFPGCLRGILICLILYGPKYGKLGTLWSHRKLQFYLVHVN